jgi:DNA-3-methyladenine glycosylase I
MQRCAWVTDDPIYIHYHDTEWGVPLYDSQKLFEFLILEGAQAGLSWITVLKKREHYREVFDNFNPNIIANYNSQKIQKLLLNKNIIRNKLKINSAVTNAQAYLNLNQDFSEYLWNFVGNKPMSNHWRTPAETPTTSSISDQMSKTLKKAGFSFVGSTICYAFMQAVGMVNDHLINCFRHKNL